MEMDWIWELLKDKGASFVLLGFAVYYFVRENKKLTDKIDSLHSDNVKQDREDRERMVSVISNNTHVMESIQKYFENR